MEIAEVEGVPVEVRHWIGGRRVASAHGRSTFADISPIDEVEIAQVARGGPDDVAAAVDAAATAFPEWSRTERRRQQRRDPRGVGPVLHRDKVPGVVPRGRRHQARPAGRRPRVEEALHRTPFARRWGRG